MTLYTRNVYIWSKVIRVVKTKSQSLLKVISNLTREDEGGTYCKTHRDRISSVWERRVGSRDIGSTAEDVTPWS